MGMVSLQCGVSTPGRVLLDGVGLGAGEEPGCVGGLDEGGWRSFGKGFVAVYMGLLLGLGV